MGRSTEVLGRRAEVPPRDPPGEPARGSAHVRQGRVQGEVREDLAITRSTKISPRALLEQSRATNRYTSYERVTNITVPTLVLHGTADRVVPFELGRTLAYRIPGARPVPLEDAGHDFIADATDDANAAVLAFLAEVSQATAPS